MPTGLVPQNIPISLSQGLDTKTDPKQVVIGKLLTLENGVFVTAKEIRKRNGYIGLATDIDGPSISSISTGAGMMTFKKELCQFTGTGLYSYSDSISRWTSKGPATSCDLSVFPVVRNTYQQTAPDSCYHSAGLYGFVWQDTRGGCRYSIFDADTNQSIVADTALNSNALNPKIVALGNYLLIFYIDSVTHNVVMRSISAFTPSVISIETSVATNVHTTNQHMDATVVGARAFVAWNASTGGGAINVKYIDSFLTISTVLAVGSEAASACLGVFGDAVSQNIWVAYYNGTAVKYFIASYGLPSTLILSATAVETIANITNVTGYVNNAAGTLFYEQSATLKFNYLTRSVSANQAGTVGTPAVLLRSVGLGSKPFNYNGTTYILVTYDSTLQPTYFLVTATGFVVGKIAPLNGGGVTAIASLPTVNLVSAGVYSVSYLQKDLLTTVSGSVFTQTGVQSGQIDFTNLTTYQRSELGNNQHIIGAVVNMYDGANLVEHGFHLFPETPTNAITTTGGGVDPGTRQYVVMWEWTDNQGQIHRSAPSIPLTVVNVAGSLTFTGNTTNLSTTITTVSSVTGLFVGQYITGTNIPAQTYITSIGTTTITISNAATGTASTTTFTTTATNINTLTIPTLRITAKTGNRSPVRAVVYRQQANLTVFYRLTSIIAPLFNTTTADTVTYADSLPDQFLSGNELLYTTGGVVENIAAPASCATCTYSSRVILIPSENRSSYWYSKQVVPGAPVEFSDVFAQNVNQAGGDITACIQMDDKLLLFKSALIYYTVWEGPDSTGAQSDIVDAVKIATDSGCINPRSVVLTPMGVMYGSAKGIYLLDRSLGVSYVGSDVEAFNNQVITSATLIANTNQVRFTTQSGTCLVYDYFFKQWAVFTNHHAVDAVIFQNEFTYLNSAGQAMQESLTTFTDNGLFIRLRLVTGWLSLAGLQGFQRARHVLILGEYKSPHQLLAKVAYDFNYAFVQEDYIDATTLLSVPAYGQDVTYGATSPYGGNFPLYEFRVNFDRQKCTAIQLSIEDVQTSPLGEGFSVSCFTLNAGLKKGTNKLAATRVVG